MTPEYLTIIVPQQEVALYLNTHAKQGWRLISAFPSAQNSYQVVCILEKATIGNAPLFG